VSAPVARHFLAAYKLRNGARGTLDVLAASSCDAIVVALDLFGDALQMASARPACPDSTPRAQTPARPRRCP